MLPVDVTRVVRDGTPGRPKPSLFADPWLCAFVLIGTGIVLFLVVVTVALVLPEVDRSGRADAVITGEVSSGDEYVVTYMWWPSDEDPSWPYSASVGMPGTVRRTTAHDWPDEPFVCFQPGRVYNRQLAHADWQGCGVQTGNMLQGASLAVPVLLCMGGLIFRRWWRLEHPERYLWPDVPRLPVLGVTWYTGGLLYWLRRVGLIALFLGRAADGVLSLILIVGLRSILAPLAMLFAGERRADLRGLKVRVAGDLSLEWVRELLHAFDRRSMDEEVMVQMYGTAANPRRPIEWLPPE